MSARPARRKDLDRIARDERVRNLGFL